MSPTHSLPALVEGSEHVSCLCLMVEFLIFQGHVPHSFLVLDTTLEQLIRHVTTVGYTHTIVMAHAQNLVKLYSPEHIHH